MEEKRNHLPTPELLQELNRLGKQIYENRVRALVEPEYDGQYVAIQVDTGDYAVGKSTAEATRALRELVSINGRGFLRKIGNEPEYDLAARIMAGQMMAVRS